MSKHTILICKSCKFKTEQPGADTPSDCSQLLNQLQAQHQIWPHQAELEIRKVDCLWTCSSPCAVAFSAPGKATYLFTQVPTTESAALLQFGEHYLASNDGTIPWKHVPEALQAANVAKIPRI